MADAPTFFYAWGGALAYTLQLYFDFSGYSDMAIGLSRIFGIRLPLNFNSPYKSRQHHRLLAALAHDPVALSARLPLHPARRQSPRPGAPPVNLMITMLLGGLWHGAGWNFVIWGGLHGVFLIVNHCWRDAMRRSRLHLPHTLSKAIGIALTFLCVVFAWVYFRAPDLQTANRVIAGMLGHWGAALPASLVTPLGSVGAMLERAGIDIYLGGGVVFLQTWCAVIVGLTIVFFAPNSQEIMPVAVEDEGVRHGMSLWQPRTAHAVLAGFVFALGVLALSRPTEFLYFQF